MDDVEIEKKSDLSFRIFAEVPTTLEYRAVAFARVPDAKDSATAVWEPRGLGVRFSIAAGNSNEASYTPITLMGKIERADASSPWETKIPPMFVAGPPNSHDPEVILELRPTATDDNKKVGFTFPAETLAATQSIPRFPVIEPRDRFPVIEPRESSDESKPVPEIYRSWMCAADGWLAIDAPKPELGTFRPDSQGSILSSVDIDKLIQALRKTIGSGRREELAGMTVALKTLSDTRVELQRVGSGTDVSLRLVLRRPQALVITPAVWYQPIRIKNKEIVPDLADNRPFSPRELPTLTPHRAAGEDPPEPEAWLQALLQPGSFLSVADSPAPSTPVAPPPHLRAVVSWDDKLQTFVLGFHPGRLCNWHRSSRHWHLACI